MTEEKIAIAFHDIQEGIVYWCPIADLIRCNDCKYMKEHYDTDGSVPYWTCSEWDSGTDYDGFCHLGKRRTDGKAD